MLQRLAPLYNIAHYLCEQCCENRAIFARFGTPCALHIFCAHLAFSLRISRDFCAIFEQFCCTFPDGCELHLECAANCHRLHPAQYEVTCSVPPLVFFPCCVVLMPRGSGSKGRSPFSHVKSRQHKARRFQSLEDKARRLQSLEDVVSRELGAPYTVQHLPDTGQIMSMPVAGGGGGGGGGGCKPYSTIPMGEDRGGGVVHPVTPSIEDRGAVPHSSSS